MFHSSAPGPERGGGLRRLCCLCAVSAGCQSAACACAASPACKAAGGSGHPNPLSLTARRLTADPQRPPRRRSRPRRRPDWPCTRRARCGQRRASARCCSNRRLVRYGSTQRTPLCRGVPRLVRSATSPADRPAVLVSSAGTQTKTKRRQTTRRADAARQSGMTTRARSGRLSLDCRSPRPRHLS